MHAWRHFFHVWPSKQLFSNIKKKFTPPVDLPPLKIQWDSYAENPFMPHLCCSAWLAPSWKGPQRHVVVSLWRSASARRTGCLRACSLPDLPGWPWNQKLGTAPALSKPRFPVSLLELRCNYCDSWIRRCSRAGEMAASTRIRPWSFFLFEDRGDVGVWRKNITHI